MNSYWSGWGVKLLSCLLLAASLEPTSIAESIPNGDGQQSVDLGGLSLQSPYLPSEALHALCDPARFSWAAPQCGLLSRRPEAGSESAVHVGARAALR